MNTRREMRLMRLQLPGMLEKARQAYGNHLMSCDQCLIGLEEISCLKGSAFYALLTVTVDVRFPQLILVNSRAKQLFDARLDFSSHSVKCKARDCGLCRELWSRVALIQIVGD